MSSKTLVTILTPQLQVLSDRLIQSDGQERLEYWKAFKTLHDVFPDKDVEYGEIYNRFLIGNVLGVLTVASETEQGNEVPVLDEHLPKRPLHLWSEDDWTCFGEYLEAATDSLSREDADAASGDLENAALHPERDNGLFIKKPEKILRYVRLHKILSCIRPILKNQLADERLKDDQYPIVDKQLVKKLWKTTMAEDDSAIKDLIIAKIFDDRDVEQIPATKIALRSLGELRAAFQAKPFAFDTFDDRINICVVELCNAVFEEPRLNAFYFPDETARNSRDMIERLRDAREALNQEGEDPMKETLRLVSALSGTGSADRGRARRTPPVRQREGRSGGRNRSSSRRTRRPSASGLYRRRETATQLKFEEEDSIEDTEEDSTGHHLSRLPKRARAIHGDLSEDDERLSTKKQRKSQDKKYDGRRGWSEEEKQAIIEGMRHLGKSQWAQIQKMYSLLEVRTSGQISDCFRTMVKRGEVPEDLL